MHFLPDVYVPCDVCHGTRYNSETLDIKFKGKTIADVLVCDSAIPLCDSIKKLTEEGLKAIIQPGGLPVDDELIEYCNTHLISMIFTGMPHISC